ncbi:hypothetical protein MTF65_08910 [Streptomyces sp. APSN-46.1]|uniref:hypothetical protein n=1 Tax=Streptomyces sp. APSN-46.1 TaxID=2929049 RepID=UPI001FB26710|nr:hypothetical protein [Streptomyces sp. APSN-46.1]MCJ1677453.1 hypothetical protein [Streptomyces sp. APSN-46.1]
MITYLLDTSALWHLFRTPGALRPREGHVAAELTQRGQHRAAGAIDLLVCATAVHHGHTVLHVDNDFATVAAVLKEAQRRAVRA